MSRNLAAISFLVLLFISCIKIEHLPPEPRIEFRSFEVSDTLDILGNDAKLGRLKFYFEDGDGDLGLKEPTFLSDSTNLFLKLYRKTGGVYTLADENDILDPSDYRIPFMVRPGQNKTLKGTISVTFLYLFYSEADTIKYEFYIKDRADNLSNSDTTCEVVLTRNEICIAK